MLLPWRADSGEWLQQSHQLFRFTDDALANSGAAGLCVGHSVLRFSLVYFLAQVQGPPQCE